MRHRKVGFTLVELLVVIAIIGVLIALLLPAVQSARESGRNTQCQNNLKSLALACVHHEQAHGFLPTGGWGWQWSGDPNRGFSSSQPGGWIFNILPYMDQLALHDLGVYSDPSQVSIAQNQMAVTVQTPLVVLHCPTRRRAVAYPYNATRGTFPVNTSTLTGTGVVPIGKTDYAANAGDFPPDNIQGTTAIGLSPGPTPSQGTATDPYGTGDATTDWSTISKDAVSATGVMYIHSQVQLVQIKDGLGKTYLCGERYICPDFYASGNGPDDSLGWDQGYDVNTFRWTSYYSIAPSPLAAANSALLAGTMINNNNAVIAAQYSPARDTAGRDASYMTTLGVGFTANRNFGSAHPATFNMAFCDGAVHPIRYNVDHLTHQYLGNRQDQLILPTMDGTSANPFPAAIDPGKYLP